MTNTDTTISSADLESLFIPWPERIAEAIILIIICLAALLGNISLWLVILRSRDLRNASNYLVLCLSMADILVSAVSMPVTVFTILKGRWVFSDVTCIAIGFISMITFIASVMSLGTISFNRFIKICHSRHYKNIYTTRNIFIMAGGVWCLSGSLAMPPLIGWGRYDFLPTQSFCFCDWTTSVSYTFFMVAACFGGPCSVMTVCYINILKTFRASKNRISDMAKKNSQPDGKGFKDTSTTQIVHVIPKPFDASRHLSSKHLSVTLERTTKGHSPQENFQNESSNRMNIYLTVPDDSNVKVKAAMEARQAEKQARRRMEEFRLTASLLLVICVFIISWLPFCVTMFISVFSPGNVSRPADMFTLLLGYANSCCNPVIYGFMNKRFKDGYKRLFCDIVPCWNNHQLSSKSEQTFIHSIDEGQRSAS